MSRYKHYLDLDVVTASRQRVAHLFDVFDTVVVMFSGGKDSLVCLELCIEEARRRNRLPLDVIFLDEELLPDSVIDFVDAYRRRPEVAMHWFCVPMRNAKFVLGVISEILSWDPGRKHVRPLPAWGIQLAAGDPRTFRQQEMDEFTHTTCGFRGRTAYVNGIRAAESPSRYRSVVNKLNENYICASSFKGVKLCKPIYDYEVSDVFKFLHDQHVPWCPAYEAQLLSGISLRVSTPLHAESAGHLGRLKAADPDFYMRLQAAFPDIDNQGRYWGEFNTQKVLDAYADGLDGCLRFIAEMPNRQKAAQAMKMYRTYAGLHRRDPASYPTRTLLKALVKGVVFRSLLNTQRKPSKGAAHV